MKEPYVRLAFVIGVLALFSACADRRTQDPPPLSESAPTGVAMVGVPTSSAPAATPSSAVATGISPSAAAPNPLVELTLIANPIHGGGPITPVTAFFAQWAPRTASVTAAVKPNKMVTALEPLVEGGDASAAVALARVYATGAAGLRDYDRAAALYLEAMAKGAQQPIYFTAEGELGQLLLLGRTTVRPRAGAIGILSDAAQHGDAGGMTGLGLAYASGLQVGTNYSTAETWLLDAQNAGGAPFADTVLGTMYLEGWGVGQDAQHAVSLYNQAANAGDDDAWVKLGEMYMYGIGVKQDYATAMQWFKKAKARDNTLAYFALAEMYSRGWGVKKGTNYTEAYVLYRTAANEGFPPAEGAAAFYNAIGLGIRHNPALALQWAQRGSAAGDPVSTTWLKRLTPAQ